MTGQRILNNLPKTICDQWKVNMEKERGSKDIARHLEKDHVSTYDFISTSFIWRHSPEGYNYWKEIAGVK